MTKTANNSTVFTTSTSIEKGDDRNHINGPPKFKNKKAEGSKAAICNSNPLAFNGEIAKRISRKDHQPKENTLGTTNGAIKYWRGQKILPDDAMTIAAIDLELKSMAYKIRAISDDKLEKRAVTYFRSSIEKRIILLLVMKNTFLAKGTSQTEMRQGLGLLKGTVSKICLECSEEGWFLRDTENNYRASKYILDLRREFSKTVFEDTSDPVLINFVMHFTNKKLRESFESVHFIDAESQ
tara:strand:+ start:221 stop:937 length:717 start_codon:yes stop_codon:yes gene_type:complete